MDDPAHVARHRVAEDEGGLARLSRPERPADRLHGADQPALLAFAKRGEPGRHIVARPPVQGAESLRAGLGEREEALPLVGGRGIAADQAALLEAAQDRG